MFFSEGKQGHNRSGGDQSPEGTGWSRGQGGNSQDVVWEKIK